MRETTSFFILFFFFLPFISWGQDTLKTEEDNENQTTEIDQSLSDSVQLELLFAEDIPLKDKFGKIDEFLTYSCSDTRIYIKYANKAITLAVREKDFYWKSSFECLLAVLYANRLWQLDSTGHYFNLALTSAKESKDQESIGEMHVQLSRYYIMDSKFDKALFHSYAAMKIFEEENYILGLGLIWSDLGSIYLETKRYEEGLEATKKAISFLEAAEGGEGFYLASNLVTRAKLFNATNDSIQAVSAYNESLVTAEKEILDKDMLFYDIYLEMAIFYMEKNDFKKAREFLDIGYAALEETSIDNSILPDWYLSSGELFFKQQEYEKAIEEFEKLNALGVFNNQTYPILADCYAAIGDFENAYTFQAKHQISSDSVQAEESIQKMNRLKTEFETEKKDETISIQKATIAQAHKIQYLTFGIITSLGVLLAGLFFFFRKNKKKNVVIEKKNAENELLLKEIHHRVKNNLETVSSLLALQSATIKDPSVLDAMQESQNRVQSMGMIHQKLYQGKNLASIEMKDYFVNLSEGILDSFGVENRVQVECVMQELELDVDTAVPIGLIVNELLTNSLKYAFPDNRNGKIKISLKELNNDNLELTIVDDGIGKNTSSVQENKGFGTQLIQLLTIQINGKLEEIINQGTMVSLVFKKANLA